MQNYSFYPPDLSGAHSTSWNIIFFLFLHINPVWTALIYRLHYARTPVAKIPTAIPIIFHLLMLGGRGGLAQISPGRKNSLVTSFGRPEASRGGNGKKFFFFGGGGGGLIALSHVCGHMYVTQCICSFVNSLTNEEVSLTAITFRTIACGPPGLISAAISAET